MTTSAITLFEWNASKFRGIPVTQATLDLINKSETIKGDIRAYETAFTVEVKLLKCARAAVGSAADSCEKVITDVFDGEGAKGPVRREVVRGPAVQHFG